jgi:tRNA(fMet)-specific endonuclease VapC
MSRATYMLDTNICSYIMRQRPASVLQHLEQISTQQHRIVVSAITYAEIRFGAINPKASPRITPMVDAFVQRLDAILPWDATAVDETAHIRQYLTANGIPISHNDAAIAGHALSQDCILVTHNMREFQRVPRLIAEDWV